MSEYIQNGTSLYKKVEPNKRVDYKTDIDEFEFDSTPETEAMLKQMFKGKTKMAIGVIDEHLTVDAEPIRHGYWICVSEEKTGDFSKFASLLKCSNCHTPFLGTSDRYHYCPNCGAKMDLVDQHPTE